MKIKQAAELQILKTDMKNIKKELKLAEEEVAELEMKNIDLANESKTVEIDTKVCQTDSHPEIPYDITAPLPPIFSLQLCHASPPINFLSRSLPRLDKMRWCQPDEYVVNDADDYLNSQYEHEIKEFYDDARNKAQEKRKDETEDHLEVKHLDKNKNLVI